MQTAKWNKPQPVECFKSLDLMAKDLANSKLFPRHGLCLNRLTDSALSAIILSHDLHKADIWIVSGPAS